MKSNIACLATSLATFRDHIRRFVLQRPRKGCVMTTNKTKQGRDNNHNMTYPARSTNDWHQLIMGRERRGEGGSPPAFSMNERRGAAGPPLHTWQKNHRTESAGGVKCAKHSRGSMQNCCLSSPVKISRNKGQPFDKYAIKLTESNRKQQVYIP